VKKTLVLALAAIMVLGVAGAAFAESVTYTDATTAGTAAGTVNVNAQVKPKITLTITTPDAAQTVDFGILEPGLDPAAETIGLAVESNKSYKLARDTTGMAPLTTAGFTVAYGALDTTTVYGNSGAAADTYSDTVDLGTVGYGITADVLYTGTILYSAVQQ